VTVMSSPFVFSSNVAKRRKREDKRPSRNDFLFFFSYGNRFFSCNLFLSPSKTCRRRWAQRLHDTISKRQRTWKRKSFVISGKSSLISSIICVRGREAVGQRIVPVLSHAHRRRDRGLTAWAFHLLVVSLRRRERHNQ
jgi:hypothetical protein